MVVHDWEKIGSAVLNQTQPKIWREKLAFWMYDCSATLLPLILFGLNLVPVPLKFQFLNSSTLLSSLFSSA